MKNSKLITLLRSFSGDEIKDFRKFVNSPYFNNEKTVCTLVNLLVSLHPGFNENKTVKETLFPKLFPGKKYNDALLRNVISRSLKLAERFLVLREFENNPGYFMLLKLRALGDKNQFFLFDKAVKSANETLQSITYRDGSYYYIKMMYEDEIRRFALRSKSMVYLPEDNYHNFIDNCVRYTATELMRAYAVIINAEKYLKEHNYKYIFLPYIMKFFEENEHFFKDMHYVHLYYNSIMLFNTNEEKYFERVYEITLRHYEQLPDIDKKNSYVVLANYCSEMINKGKTEYLSRKFSIYREILERNAQYEGLDYISHVFYNRVVNCAVSLGELKFAEEFMARYTRELPGEHREGTYNLALADLYLKKAEYSKAIEVLAKVKKLDRLYKQQLYPMLIKIYYCAGETESFLSAVSSFKEFLKTSDIISERHRKLDSNFIKLVTALFKLRDEGESKTKSRLAILKDEIIKNEYTSEKFWLLEMLKELK